jgi:hypothetical protein
MLNKVILIGYVGDLIGCEFNAETERGEPFLIASTCDLDKDFVYVKERRLVEEVKASLERGRKVQITRSIRRSAR